MCSAIALRAAVILTNRVFAKQFVHTDPIDILALVNTPAVQRMKGPLTESADTNDCVAGIAPSPLDPAPWLAMLLAAHATQTAPPPRHTGEIEARMRHIDLAAVVSAIERARPGLTGPAEIQLYLDWIAANAGASRLSFAAWFNLGVAYAREGDCDSAAAAYHNARALNMDFDPAAINLRLLLEAKSRMDKVLPTWPASLPTVFESDRPSFAGFEGRVQHGTSLLIEGWRGVNHSYGLINQYQILEFLKTGGLRLFHHDLPFFNKLWNRIDNDASFSPSAQQRIDALPPAGDAHIDCVYRISSPIPAGADIDKRRTLTFMVTEFGLVESNLAAEPSGYQFFTRGDNCIVTPTRWSQERIVEFGFPAEKVRIVPHGADTTIFSPLPVGQRAISRADLGIREDETVFVNVGGAFWNKGIDLLLRGFATLRSKGRQVRLIIKDQRGLYGAAIEQTIQNAGKDYPPLLHPDTLAAISVIRDNLARPELRALYGIADCYVSPYRAEGFNLPVLEAIACGTPVIVTQGGATDDFCSDGVALRIPGLFRTMDGSIYRRGGRYIEPDFDALISAMDAFATGHRFDEARCAADRHHVLEAFSWKRAADELARLAIGGTDVETTGREPDAALQDRGWIASAAA